MGAPLTDEERTKLINRLKDKPPEAERNMLLQKLEDDIDNFVNTREKTPYTEGWNEETFAEEMEQHPAFMTKMPEPGQPLPPLVEALQQLKYGTDENTPEELAENYKEDGNFNFKGRRFHLAVTAYTEGLKQVHENTMLKVQLYSNRAAAEYHLKNYRSSFLDCKEALKLKPDHLKALHRAAECCKQRGKFDECVVWCDKILALHPSDKQMQQLRTNANQLQKKKLLEERKNSKKEKAEADSIEAVIKAIKSRGVLLPRYEDVSLDDLTPRVPMVVGCRVALDENKRLIWPVMFLYPEYGESDFISGFHEDVCFQHHLEDMFGENAEKAHFDEEGKYKSSNLVIYYEADYKVHHVDSSLTLSEVLSQGKLMVRSGTPEFAVLVDGSAAQKEFLRRYEGVRS